MPLDPPDVNNEYSGYEALADDGMPPGGIESFRQLSLQRQLRSAIALLKREIWKKWMVQIALTLTGALFGLIGCTALTGDWGQFDLRFLVLLTAGALPPAAAYWKLIQRHAEAVMASSVISREAELALLRHDPTISAARMAFFVALPAATFGAAATSKSPQIAYPVVIGCELLLLAPYWVWLVVCRRRERLDEI